MTAASDPTPNILLPNVGLEADPDIYDAVKRLALATIDASVEIIDTAAPAQQLQMIRILLPRLTGALRTAPEDDKGELRAGVTAIFDEIRGVIDPPAPPEESSAAD